MTLRHPRLPVSAALAVLISACGGESPNADQPTCSPNWAGTGDATWYRVGTPTACTLNPESRLTAAINTDDYDRSKHCGECLEVVGPKGSVVVRITDRCPACGNDGLDLSPQAFKRIAQREDGRVSVAWHRVACPVTEPLAFRFQGSNPYYLKLEVLGHRYGIASLSLLDPPSDNWIPMHRTRDNHFELSPPHAVRGAMSVRLTATTGEQLVARIPGIRNGQRTSGDEQFAPCE